MLRPCTATCWPLRGVQVGSKNAAFYLGRCIRVATKPADSAYVHELGIAAEALEARYRDKQARTDSLATYQYVRSDMKPDPLIHARHAACADEVQTAMRQHEAWTCHMDLLNCSIASKC